MVNRNKRTSSRLMNRDWSEAYWINDDGCWLFTGAISSNGYGSIKNHGAHRWFYEHYVGPIPTGLQIDHLCRVKRCVNPNHLEAVTARENMRRRPISLAYATYCHKGHEMTGKNRYEYKRSETHTEVRCIKCDRIRQTELRRRKRTPAG